MLMERMAPGRPNTARNHSPHGIRSVSETELDGFRRHLLRLTDDCRQSRFGSVATDAFLHDYAGRVDLANTRLLAYMEENQIVAFFLPLRLASA